MPKKLPAAEIKKRLQDLRNVRMLHERAKARIAKLEALLKTKDELLLQKDSRIAELETELLDKEAQRKALAAKLWKARKHRQQADPATGNQTGDAAGDSPANLPATPKPGAQPGHVAARRPTPKPEDVTDRRIFDLARCPSCKHQVGDAVDTAERYQEDIDLAPKNKIVRHYTITRHWCGNCQEYVRPVDTPAQHLRRFGPNVMAYILYARYRLRLPLLKIQESLSDLHAFTLSEGEIQHQLDEARESFGEEYDLICELIRTAKVVYADESGWRMDGDNWYLWAFVSPEDGVIRYELSETRGGGVAKEALVDPAKEQAGSYDDRVIVSDGYAVYGNLPGFNQQCWVHLLRVAKEKTTQVYGELCVVYAALLVELGKPLEQRTADRKQTITVQLQTIRDKDYNLTKRGKPMKTPVEPLALEVQQRIASHFNQLLVCLDYDQVLPENNTAERVIRPQVILRKIFGGNRSPTGAKTHAVNTSVIATKLAQNKGSGKSFFEIMLPLITELHGKPKAKTQAATPASVAAQAADTS
jgi:transposase